MYPFLRAGPGFCIPWVWVSLLHFLLPVVPPPEAIIHKVDVAHGVDDDSRLAHRPAAGHGDPLAVNAFPPAKGYTEMVQK